MAKAEKKTDISHLKEAEEEAKIIIESTVTRLRHMGFSLVGYGKVKGRGVQIVELLAVRSVLLEKE